MTSCVKTTTAHKMSVSLKHLLEGRQCCLISRLTPRPIFLSSRSGREHAVERAVLSTQVQFELFPYPYKLSPDADVAL